VPRPSPHPPSPTALQIANHSLLSLITLVILKPQLLIGNLCLMCPELAIMLGIAWTELTLALELATIKGNYALLAGLMKMETL